MTLFTKSILAPKSETDGTRISVMSRHTLNDGITPNPEITEDSYDEWLPELAPTPKLIGDYYKRGLSWEEFSESFEKLIQEEKRAILIQQIAKRALFETITLMCVEEDPEHCHRKILAEECKKSELELEVVIR